MASIDMKNIVKKYGDGFPAVNDISLDIADGEFMILVGPSGCGKSTLLRMIVGLEDITSGDMVIGGKRVNDKAPRDRNLSMVFQNYALYPHLTVYENIAFPLREHYRLPEDLIRTLVLMKLHAVGLRGAHALMPGDLSGGMKKRAGLARAMALDPAILLVDEPSAGLDPITAGEIDELLVKTKQGGTTLVVVTHNIPSARVIGDDFAVLHEGRMLVHGTQQDLDASQDPLVQAFMRSQSGG